MPITYRQYFQNLQSSFSKSIVTAGFVSILVLASILISWIPSRAQDEVSVPSELLILTDEQAEYPLGWHMDLLEDPGGVLTIEDVSSPEFDARFTPSQEEVPNFGYTSSVYWVRLRFDNQAVQTDEWLLEVGFANTQFLDLFIPSNDSQAFEVRQTGILRPSSTRDVIFPRIVFDLNIPTGSQQIYYLRFQSGASMNLGLTLWTKNVFLNHSSQEQMRYWLFFGALGTLLLYHLFLLFQLREPVYAFLIIVLASMLIHELATNGYLTVYIFPSLYGLLTFILPQSVIFLHASIILFSDAFFEIEKRFPKLRWMNIGILVMWGVLMLRAPFASYLSNARLIIPLGLISLIVILLEGIIARRSTKLSYRLVILAWLGMVISLIVIHLVRLGIAPSTFLNENFYHLGLLLMAVSWSLALADRINRFRSETELANRNLQNSEHRLAQILEGMPLGVVVYGADLNIQYVNRRRNEILSNMADAIQSDAGAKQTVDQVVETFDFRVAGTAEKYPFEKLPAVTALQGKPFSIDDIEAHIGGRTIPLEVWANPVRDEAGNIGSAVLVIQDITERKRAAAELAEYQQHLESLVEVRTEELNQVNQQLQQRIEWLSVVNRVHQSITGVANLEGAYEELSARILALTGASLVFILRWEDAGEKSAIVNCSLQGGETCEINDLKDLFQTKAPLRYEIDSGNIKTWTEDQVVTLPEPVREFLKENDIGLLILAPMVVRQLSIGVLGVAFHESSQDPMLQQLGLVERMALDLANMAGDAIVLDQALDLATVEERSRLARDLHDSVTQVLFSATLLAEVLPKIWERDPEQGIQKVDKLRNLTRGALAEMRTLLLELRPSAVINTPLSELLTQLTEAISSRSGLKFQLSIEKVPLLPETVQESFYHIAQEALNNVVKHAQAGLVTIDLSVSKPSSDQGGGGRNEVRLVIQDDGVGYSSGNSHPSRLGLEIMRERAAAIQASISQESQPGYGTRVTLIWRGETGSVK